MISAFRTSLTLVFALEMMKLVSAQGEDCQRDIVGPDETGSEFEIAGVPIEGILMRFDGVVSVNCSGVIEEWMVNFTDFGCGQDVYFQIWRPDPGGHNLVAENRFPLLEICSGDTGQSWEVPPQYRIPVQTNDVIGWRHHMDFLLPNDTTSPIFFSDFGGFVSIQQEDGPCSFPPSAGDTCDWNAANTGSMRFSVNARLGEPNEIYYINMNDTPISITVNNLVTPGSLLYRVKASFEHNAQDVVLPTLIYEFVSTESDPVGCCDQFSIDRYTGEIRAAINVPISMNCLLKIMVSLEDWPTDVIVSNATYLEVLYEEWVNPVLRMDGLPNTAFIDTSDTNQNTVDYLIYKGNIACDPPDVCENEQCFIVSTEPSFPPFAINVEITDNLTKEYELTLVENVANWQSPERYDIGIACSCNRSITEVGNLVVIFTNMREAPVSDLPYSVMIPEEPINYTACYWVNGHYMPSNVLARSDVTYIITKVYPPSAYPDFDIDDYGCLSYNGSSLDFFTTSTYNIEIVVVDEDLLHSAEPANLTIHISWVNQPPRFIATSYTTRIPEDLPVGAALPGVKLEATDRDIQGEDWVTYTLIDEGPPPRGAFRFTPDNITSLVYVDDVLTIVTPGVSDITYSMVVNVFDSYGERAMPPASLTVVVFDINDNAPVFNPIAYFGSVNESDFGPTYVTTVTATDDDAGDNARIIYSIIEKEAQQYFQVGPSSGVVSLVQPISYISHPNITFTVKATDQGDPPLSSTATVTVNVKEVNSHEPVFDPVYYSVETRSDLPVGESVLQVSATDLDSEGVNNPSYYLLTIQEEFDMFEDTGFIYVGGILQPGKKYDLFVNTRDNGKPNMKSDPAYVRIDTFEAGSVLFDIYLHLPLQTFLTMQETFMEELNKLLSPWTVVMDRVLLDHDTTVVRCYVMSEVPPPEDFHSPKTFVNVVDVMNRLQENDAGTPSTGLRGPAFADFEPFKVLPSYPNWWTDTPGGLATLAILSVIPLVGAIVGVLVCKTKELLCFSQRSVKPLPRASSLVIQKTKAPPQEDFAFGY